LTIIMDDIIAQKREGEEEMSQIIKLNCPECDKRGEQNKVSLMCDGDFSIKGIMQCLRCQHERPIIMAKDCLQALSIALPGEQSSKLHSSVPLDIQEDVREAERANYAQCYKSCVTMCRRALQLALLDKGIKDGPLSKMLDDAVQHKDKLLDQNTFNLATSIKGYGDIGTHRKEQLEPEEVRIVIHMAVKMLNELFQ
jgi:hypothetical protein